VWPIINWLYWWALREQHAEQAARELRAANLDLLRAPGSRFAEYFDPYTAKPLGSLDQSWTAAAVLDWLSVTD
jgi:glycogen debranching enzyme